MNRFTAATLATVLLLVATLPGCSSGEAEPSAALETAELEGLVRAELLTLRDAYGFPGATAAFVLSDGRSASVAVGVEQIPENLPMPVDARMPAGSVGKIFVAGVVISLIEDGVIAWDDPLSRWTRGKPWYPRLPHAGEITLRMLLTHSAGVPNHIPDPLFAELMRSYLGRDEYPTPDELAETIVRVDPTGEPGQSWAYTDAGFVLAGIAIEEAAGLSYWQLLQTRVLDPFALTRTVPGNRRKIEGVVQGFVGPGGMFGHPEWALEQGRFVINPAIEYTGGGVVSHPADLARWARELWSGRAFGESSLEILFDSVPLDNTNPEGVRYGLGVFIEDTPLGRRYSHRGTYPGYKSIVGYLAEHDLAIAVQINSSEPSGAIKEIFDPIARTLLAAKR